MSVLWKKTRQGSGRIFRNLGAQVGILRRVIRRGASEKVTVEQRESRQADNGRKAQSRSVVEPRRLARGSVGGDRGARGEVTEERCGADHVEPHRASSPAWSGELLRASEQGSSLRWLPCCKNHWLLCWNRLYRSRVETGSLLRGLHSDRV